MHMFDEYAHVFVDMLLGRNDMNNIREICAKRSEWKSEYNSNGRRIDVDVPIVIPDVKKIPVISVKTILCGKWAMFGEQSRTDGKDR